MRLTRPLRRPTPRFPLDVHPLAILHADGRLELLQPAFPPSGRVALALWRPGEDPAFTVSEGVMASGWRFAPAPEPAFVVAWARIEDLKEAF
ncbi:MAG TPA: hypothetical protein VM370_05230 [Candidatus Thermoplasmatota archaeon]|nr:hypothetical protein [Candidatus Thermoplasmatota archaeon]